MFEEILEFAVDFVRELRKEGRTRLAVTNSTLSSASDSTHYKETVVLALSVLEIR